MPYHISNNGTLTPCKAKPGKCPLGGRHFLDEQTGMEYLTTKTKKKTLLKTTNLLLLHSKERKSLLKFNHLITNSDLMNMQIFQK